MVMGHMLFPMVRAGRQLRGVGHRRAGEALVSRGRRVNAEGYPIRVDLVDDETVEPLLDLGDAGQVPLPLVVERPLGRRLKVHHVPPDAGRGRRVAA